MTPEEYEILFGEPMPSDTATRTVEGVRPSPWSRRLRTVAARWIVRRRRERLAVVVLAAFIAVGLSLVGGLNSAIVPIEKATGFDTEFVADLQSRTVVDSLPVSALGSTTTTTSAPATTIAVEVLGSTEQVDATPTTAPQTTTTVGVTTTTAVPLEVTATTAAGSVSLSVNVEPAPVSPELPEGNCHPNYEPCVPDVNYVLICDDFDFAVTIVGGADPYGFDSDEDGVGCERSID